MTAPTISLRLRFKKTNRGKKEKQILSQIEEGILHRGFHPCVLLSYTPIRGVNTGMQAMHSKSRGRFAFPQNTVFFMSISKTIYVFAVNQPNRKEALKVFRIPPKFVY